MTDLFERLDHTSIAVHDLEDILPLMDMVGARFVEGADNQRNGFRWLQFELAGSKLEFIAPTRSDSFLTKFLADQGDGLHHLTFKVADLDAAISRAVADGYEVVGRNEAPNWREAFLHPRSSHGVLIQLAAWDDSVPAGSSDLAAVLAGEIFDGA